MTSNLRDAHAALWLIGKDMPGLLNRGARFVASHGGNIDKIIADKFGEKCVIFMSLTGSTESIAAMEADKGTLKQQTGLGVVFEVMKEPTVPEGYKDDLYGFDIVCDDAVGLIAEVTRLLGEFDVLVVGHTGERRVIPGPKPIAQSGQKYVVMLPQQFDQLTFTRELCDMVRRFNGRLVTPLKRVPGLLWWWEW